MLTISAVVLTSRAYLTHIPLPHRHRCTQSQHDGLKLVGSAQQSSNRCFRQPLTQLTLYRGDITCGKRRHSGQKVSFVAGNLCAAQAPDIHTLVAMSVPM